MGRKYINSIFTVLFCLLLCQSRFALGETDSSKKWRKSSFLAQCTGQSYRAKRDGVPVYNEPKRTAGVIYKLKLGEKVCYIGEQGDFAILDWSVQDAKSKRLTKQPTNGKLSAEAGSASEAGSALQAKSAKVKKKKSKLAFVRLNLLWEPQSPRPKSRHPAVNFFESAKRQFMYMLNGGVPDDALAPYRPLMDLWPELDEPLKTGKDSAKEPKATPRAKQTLKPDGN